MQPPSPIITIFKVFGMTRPGIEPSTCRTRDVRSIITLLRRLSVRVIFSVSVSKVFNADINIYLFSYITAFSGLATGPTGPLIMTPVSQSVSLNANP